MLFSGVFSSPEQQFRMDYNESIFVSRVPIVSQNMLLKEIKIISILQNYFYTSLLAWKKNLNIRNRQFPGKKSKTTVKLSQQKTFIFLERSTKEEIPQSP